MVVSLTQGGRNIKGANFDGSKVVKMCIENKSLSRKVNLWIYYYCKLKYDFNLICR